jgi:hypothetical protein
MSMADGQEFDDFIEELMKAPGYAKENTMCYFYHNISACRKCPKFEDCPNREPRPIKPATNEEVKYKSEIYIDFEGTVIDNLNDCNILKENCENISKFLKGCESTFRFLKTMGNMNDGSYKPYRVNFFTWGLTDKDLDHPTRSLDIQHLVKIIFAELGVPLDMQGSVYTKDLSVRGAIEDKYLLPEDFDRAICPGMMKEFGLCKTNCFLADIRGQRLKSGERSTILIDDLVEMDVLEKSSHIISLVEDNNKMIYLINPLNMGVKNEL